MKPKPLLFVAGLIFFIACFALLAISPVWKQLRFVDLMAILGMGISSGVLITWIAARFTPPPGAPK
jgi:hypothetical protein